MPTLPVPKQDPAILVVHAPKLTSFQKRTLNDKVVEPLQEWMAANKEALRAQAHSGVDGAVTAVVPVVHGWVDAGVGWVSVKVAALKF
jgi:hypothetical protein